MLSLKIVKGAELAEGVRLEVKLPQPLQRFAIGRDPGNAWPIPDKTLAISARHCELISGASGVLLRDLSTNGTFVNGSIVRLQGDHRLQGGDRFELGPFTIQVVAPAMDLEMPDLELPHPTTMPGVKPAAPAGPVVPVVPAAATPPAAVGRGGDPAAGRGGDPAAMFASGTAAAGAGVTEIIRNTPPSEDSGVEMTKIRAAPKAAPKAPVAPPPTTAPAAPAAAPAAAPDPVLHALAAGLGLAPCALAGRDPAATARQVAELARSAVLTLRTVLDPAAPGSPPAAAESTLLALLKPPPGDK